MSETKATATQLGRDTAEKVREQMATNELAQRAKEAAYTIVGLTVMGAQRATQAANKLRTTDASNLDVEQLRTKTKDASDAARRRFTQVDEVLAGALARIEDAMAPLEERLPAAAKDTVQKAKDTGKGIHAQIRSRVASPDEPTEQPAEALDAPKARARAEKAEKAEKPAKDGED